MIQIEIVSLVLIRFPRTLPISIVKKRASCAIAPVLVRSSRQTFLVRRPPDFTRGDQQGPCVQRKNMLPAHRPEKLNVRSGVEASDYPVALSYRSLACAADRPTRCSVKEVIQPQVPLRLPCYDFAPVTALALGGLAPCGFRHRLRALTASMA